jgi:hypothetical protein
MRPEGVILEKKIKTGDISLETGRKPRANDQRQSALPVMAQRCVSCSMLGVKN